MPVSETDLKLSYAKVKRQELAIKKLETTLSQTQSDLDKCYERLDALRAEQEALERKDKRVKDQAYFNEKIANGTFTPTKPCWRGAKCNAPNCTFKHD